MGRPTKVETQALLGSCEESVTRALRSLNEKGPSQFYTSFRMTGWTVTTLMPP
jgi:hypothetical protein